jgi:hypothetical protein
MRVGDRVFLCCPENARLNGAGAVVAELTTWGAHVDCPAAATGRYRAAFGEMLLERFGSGPAAVPSGVGGYTGNSCTQCGSPKMVRNGACELCTDCGNTTGCS